MNPAAATTNAINDPVTVFVDAALGLYGMIGAVLLVIGARGTSHPSQGSSAGAGAAPEPEAGELPPAVGAEPLEPDGELPAAGMSDGAAAAAVLGAGAAPPAAGAAGAGDSPAGTGAAGAGAEPPAGAAPAGAPPAGDEPLPLPAQSSPLQLSPPAAGVGAAGAGVGAGATYGPCEMGKVIGTVITSATVHQDFCAMMTYLV